MIRVPWDESIELAGTDLHLFGLLVGVAVAVSVELLRRTLGWRGVPPRHAYALGATAVVAGMAGAKVNFLLEHPPRAWTPGVLFDGAGLTWYGGVVAGAIAVLLVARVLGLRAVTVVDAFAAPLAIGLAIARLGCLAVADGDYGRPTSLPWATAWPNGLVPTTSGSMNEHFGLALPGPADRLWFVHPAPAYELVPLLALGAVLLVLGRRGTLGPGVAFATWAIVAGTVRLLVEEVRLNDPVVAGLSAAQVASLAQVAVGVLVVRIAVARARRPGVAGSPDEAPAPQA